MNYCIRNNRNVYIKLNDNGCAVTCAESMKGVFEHSKAKNILLSLPKALKRMNFRVEAIPDISPREEEKIVERKIIQKDNYMLSENITLWVDKFGLCADILDGQNSEKMS